MLMSLAHRMNTHAPPKAHITAFKSIDDRQLANATPPAPTAMQAAGVVSASAMRIPLFGSEAEIGWLAKIRAGEKCPSGEDAYGDAQD